MKRNYGPYGIAILLTAFVVALVLLATPVTQVSAQTKGEDCDNGRDDDGDKKTDCADPDCANDPACTKEPPPGQGCSPGYWKNHLDHFNEVCGSVPGWTCESLLTAITCRGNNDACRRTEAADALNAVSGCTE